MADKLKRAARMAAQWVTRANQARAREANEQLAAEFRRKSLNAAEELETLLSRRIAKLEGELRFARTEGVIGEDPRVPERTLSHVCSISGA